MEFDSREEAVQHLIAALNAEGQAGADKYDVEAIADAVLADADNGYKQLVDEDEFWEIADANSLKRRAE